MNDNIFNNNIKKLQKNKYNFRAVNKLKYYTGSSEKYRPCTGAGCFGAWGAGTTCTGADNVKNGWNQDSESMTGLEFFLCSFFKCKNWLYKRNG